MTSTINPIRTTINFLMIIHTLNDLHQKTKPKDMIAFIKFSVTIQIATLDCFTSIRAPFSTEHTSLPPAFSKSHTLSDSTSHRLICGPSSVLQNVVCTSLFPLLLLQTYSSGIARDCSNSISMNFNFSIF